MKKIWRRETSLADLNRLSRNTMLEHLEIEFTDIGEDYLKAKMPVDHRTVQPMGKLHGGASVALAESLGSVAGSLCVDSNSQYCVGLEINANHIRSVKTGWVNGMVHPIHIGQKTQVWEIKIRDDQNNLVSVSRITLMVMNK